jgi:hypothetical protein
MTPDITDVPPHTPVTFTRSGRTLHGKLLQASADRCFILRNHQVYEEWNDIVEVDMDAVRRGEHPGDFNADRSFDGPTQLHTE